MNVLKDFCIEYGMLFLSAVLTALAGLAGEQIHRFLQSRMQDETKHRVVETVVQAVEQVYADLCGAEKKEKALERIASLLTEKKIRTTPLELDMLLESVVGALNRAKTE